MVIETQSRVYTNNAIQKGPAYYEYSLYKLEYGNIDTYKIKDYIGKGKYSQVFKGTTKDRNLCVIKVLKPVREKKICREAKILKTLVGLPNVVQLLDIVKDPESGTRALVFKYQKHEETRALFKRFTLEDIRYYSREILKTLDSVHSLGIMHRDLKPHNIIIDHDSKEIKIIDWGLAEYYIPGTSYSVGVASMHFKAPELLVNYRHYDYSLDLWTFGCVLCEMVLKRMPMFNGSSNEDQLAKIVKVLGKDKFTFYIQKYGIIPSPNLLACIKNCPKEGLWPKLKEEASKTFGAHTKQIFEVLEGVLQYDHQNRLTAQECLNLPFFQ
ncbi:casein kinase II subunit alpha [Nematocida homosporus]|uniref:casein kinase II subunit alpha n=1 Tax=Nematocida homosporus TaxID=1912981 RepID=UPI0022200D7B|nr:casein kinase II subunit alpha [Nematocida homosporus]KAI5184930.1 casein kinase II subunit alpha [Nematocida homosporus]